MDLNNSEIFKTEEKVSEIALKETSLKVIPKNSVLIAMYGGFNQIGRTGLLRIAATTNQALTAIILTNEIIESEFLINWLNFRRTAWKDFAASSRKDPNITMNDVRKFLVAVPPIEEQLRIVKMLDIMSKKISNEEKKLSQLQNIKKGLMQVLLTGKVRVKVDEQEVS